MELFQRLTYENQVLERDGMSQFRIYRAQDNDYYLSGDHRTNSRNIYTLWCPIPYGFHTHALPCMSIRLTRFLHGEELTP